MKRLLAIWLAVLVCLCGAIPRGWAEEPAPEAVDEYVPPESDDADADGGNTLPSLPADEQDGTGDPLTEPAPDAGKEPDAEPPSASDDTDAEVLPDIPEDGSGTETKTEEAVTDTEMPAESPDVPEEAAVPDADEVQDGDPEDQTQISDTNGEKDGAESDEPETPAAAGDIEPPETKEENDIIEDGESPDVSEKPEDTSGPETDRPEDAEPPIAAETDEEPERIADDPETEEANAIGTGIETASDIDTEFGQDPDSDPELSDADTAAPMAEDETEDPETADEDTAAGLSSEPDTDKPALKSADGAVSDIADDPASDSADDKGENDEETALPQPEEGQLVAVIEDVSELSVPETDADDAEALLRAYLEKLLRESLANTGLLRSIRVDGRLDETCLALYQQLKPKIEAIAAGEQSSTELKVSYEALGLPTRFTAEELGLTINDAADINAGVSLVAEQLKINYALVQLALLANCPYELYWYDKSQGARTTATPGMSVRNINGEYVYIVTSDYNVRMAVSDDYSADTYKVDTSVGQRVQRSIGTAQQIVQKYRELNDLEKLEAYRDEICRLVSYNGGAVGGGQAYGDPWQLIYVFDEDSGTNVVCEGYAKAFQYLCDMTEFDGDVNCYTVTGRMEWGTGEGTHMWNIVTMSDGQNYLVDLTNSDSGTIGADGSLFLVGEADEDGGTLIFHNENGQTIRYQYNDDTVSLYTKEELTLAGKKYEATCHLDLYPYHTLVGYPQIAPTCEDTGRAAYWYCRQDGRMFSDARGATEWAEDELEIPKLGHDYGEWTQTVAPACDAEGEEQRICRRDETHTETRAVAATGHRLKKVPARAATYTAEGRIAHWRCTRCGKLFADADGSIGLTAGETVIPKKMKKSAPAAQTREAPDADDPDALAGWRIARIGELLTDSELLRFNGLSLHEQLSVLAAVLSGDIRAAGADTAAELAQVILADPARAAAFRAVYPAASRSGAGSSAPAYEVLLVRNTDGDQRIVLISVDENGKLTVQ